MAEVTNRGFSTAEGGCSHIGTLLDECGWPARALLLKKRRRRLAGEVKPWRVEVLSQRPRGAGELRRRHELSGKPARRLLENSKGGPGYSGRTNPEIRVDRQSSAAD